MKTARLVQARRLFNSPYVDRHANRRNMRAWCRSLRMLGDKWVGLSVNQAKEWGK